MKTAAPTASTLPGYGAATASPIEVLAFPSADTPGAVFFELIGGKLHYIGRADAREPQAGHRKCSCDAATAKPDAKEGPSN